MGARLIHISTDCVFSGPDGRAAPNGLTARPAGALFCRACLAADRSLEPSQVLVALERAGVLIGYGGLVHISWANRRAEVSFLLTPELEKNPDELIALFLRFLDG